MEMTNLNHKLIAKQQLEIEELKTVISEIGEICSGVMNHLCWSEQWDIKCPDFPRLAMTAIVKSRRSIEDILALPGVDNE